MGPKLRRRKRRFQMPPWLSVLLLALGAGAVSLYLGATRSYWVPTASMEPTLLKGDQFQADTYFALKRPPKRGEIWVLRNPEPMAGNGPILVKRVIGLPGEKIGVTKGQVTINGKPLSEPYCSEKIAYQMPVTKLKDSEYWVLGDNRNYSEDSHLWGPLRQEMFIGKALVRYWPPTRFKRF